MLDRNSDALDGFEGEFFDLLDQGDIYDQMGHVVFERPTDFFLN